MFARRDTGGQFGTKVWGWRKRAEIADYKFHRPYNISPAHKPTFKLQRSKAFNLTENLHSALEALAKSIH
jgi:hypothetical protein